MSNISFNNITIVGFLSIGEVVDFNLKEQGFVSVVGVNKELSEVQSNGSGKSSIFDAIMWTLTGETCRGASNVVNEKTQSGCLCELHLTVDSQNYLIRRTKSHTEYGTTLQVYEEGDLLSDQVNKSKELISKIIPAVSSPEVLGSIVLLGQGLPYRFSSLSPIRRKELLETLSGSSRETESLSFQLNKMKSQVQDHWSSMRSAQDKLIGSNEYLQKELDTLSEKIENSSRLSDLKNEQERVRLEVTRLEETLVKLKDPKRFEELESKVSDLKTLYDEIRKKAGERRSQRDNVVRAFSLLKDGSCPTCGRAYELSQEDQNKKIILKDKMSQYDQLLINYDEKLSSIYREIEDLNSLISNRKVSISKTESEILSLKNTESEYLRTIGEYNTYADRFNRIKSEINDNLVKISELGKEVDSDSETLDCIGYLSRLASKDFKGYLLQEVVEFISTKSRYYGHYLFDESYDIEVVLSGNKIIITCNGRPYENLSGGERQRADLAVQFALKDMLSVTTGFTCNILVLDEAFDNLDSQGSISLVNLINSELSDAESLFIITHHSEIDIPYDKQVFVIKDEGGISRIEEKLS